MVLSIHRLLAFAGLAALIHGCSDMEAEPIKPSDDDLPAPGAVGEACLVSGENNPLFSSHQIFEDTLETGAFEQCESGICMMNHFQGRVSCPLGQAAPAACSGPSDASCGAGAACVAAVTIPIYCDPDAPAVEAQCPGVGDVCNPQRRSCECTDDAHCPTGTACDLVAKECKQYVCHQAGNCQSAGAGEGENAGKSCCVPGTDTPVVGPVCGQCAEGSKRDAEDSAYCTCRCGAADGAPADDDAVYCACPDDFECVELRPYLGLDVADTGKYCMKAGTKLLSEVALDEQCGEVSGHFEPGVCAGTAAGQ